MHNKGSRLSKILQLQALLAQGSSVAAPDREGRSPLHYAAAGRDSCKILFQITKYAVYVCEFGSLPQHGSMKLTCCFAGNQAAAVMLLVKHNANVHSKGATGDSALHVAAAQGSVAALEALLSEVRVSTSCTYSQQP